MRQPEYLTILISNVSEIHTQKDGLLRLCIFHSDCFFTYYFMFRCYQVSFTIYGHVHIWSYLLANIAVQRNSDQYSNSPNL